MAKISLALLLLAGPGGAGQTVSAPGGVAAGRDITGPVTITGVPYEKLEEAVRSKTKDLKDLSDSQKDTIALLKEKLDLNQRQVR
ncbi:MAG: hypothetical protein ACRED2_03090, partial [Methylocella sp.]